MEPSKIFDIMAKDNAEVIYLDDMQGCLGNIPVEYTAHVKQILVNYIFTYKNFEINKQTFLRLFSKDQDEIPMYVHIDLQVLIGNEPIKKQPKLFSLRLLKRLKDKQSSSISLRRILDESEEFCEK